MKFSNVIVSEGGDLLEKTSKYDIERAIVNVMCDHLTSTNHTPMSRLDMINQIFLLGDK